MKTNTKKNVRNTNHVATIALGASLAIGLFLPPHVGRAEEPIAKEPSVDARNANTNGTYQICAPSGLYLRNEHNGPAIDRLKDGTHFEVTASAGGNWVYGYSYWAKKSGWVQNGHFC